MKVSRRTACEICGSDDALQECRLCGSLVCSECLGSEATLCLTCEEARCEICGEYLSSRACNLCGKLVCEDHGSRLNEVTVCNTCGESEE